MVIFSVKYHTKRISTELIRGAIALETAMGQHQEVLTRILEALFLRRFA